MKKIIIILIAILNFSAGFAQTKALPYTATILLRNCNKDMHVTGFTPKMHFFHHWVYDDFEGDINKTLVFSSGEKPNIPNLLKEVNKIKASLPPKFWTFPMGQVWYDNVPNQDSVWFIEMYVRVDKNNNVKIFSAIKIVFEGTNATTIIDQEKEISINYIEFITDKEKLKELETMLKRATLAG